METLKPTFTQAIKGGLISGVVAAPLNLTWNLIAPSLGSVPPPNFMIAVAVSSILPLLIGAILYFLLVKYSKNGRMIFLVVSAVFTIVSLYGTIQPTMPDGTAAPQGFALLTIPMHLIAGAVAMWGIPKFSN